MSTYSNWQQVVIVICLLGAFCSGMVLEYCFPWVGKNELPLMLMAIAGTSAGILTMVPHRAAGVVLCALWSLGVAPALAYHAYQWRLAEQHMDRVHFAQRFELTVDDPVVTFAYEHFPAALRAKCHTSEELMQHILRYRELHAQSVEEAARKEEKRLYGV